MTPAGIHTCHSSMFMIPRKKTESDTERNESVFDLYE